MWTARFGHLESGIILSQWAPATVCKRDRNGTGLNSSQMAVSRGFNKFASELEKLEHIQGSRGKGTPPGFTQHHIENEDFSMSKYWLKGRPSSTSSRSL